MESWVIGLLGTAVLCIVVAVPWTSILRKAGYSPWLALWFVFPAAWIFVLYWFAFSSWPIHREGVAAREMSR